MSRFTRAQRDEMIRQRRKRDLGPDGLEGLMNRSATWSTCVQLHELSPSKELGRVMGAIASALRSGSEITHEDWGDDWIEYSLRYLDGMEPLKELASAREYSKLNDWLNENEDRIVQMLHSAYVQHAREEGNLDDPRGC